MTTSDVGNAVDRARAEISQAVHKASPFVEKFARVGYAAKGVIYVVVGALAAMAALGVGRGETTGSRGAMNTIFDQPFGRVLLAVVALGLACYALWQFIRAIEDPENEGKGGKGATKRAGFFISGLVHAGLVIYAAHTVLGTGRRSGGGDDEGARSWSAWVMSFPLGRIVLCLIGAGIAAYGIYQLYKAYKGGFDKQLALGRLRADARRAVLWVSRFGTAARGVVFGIMGVFLVIAAVNYDASEARGIGGAMEVLRRQQFGPWLLGAVALGLIAYGIFQFVKARYRRIET